MPDGGLDSDKLRVLQEWGAGLQGDPRAEVAAAGRAILMLVEEIERLHVLVWDLRLYPQPPAAEPEPVDLTEEAPELPTTLRHRLLRWAPQRR